MTHRPRFPRFRPKSKQRVRLAVVAVVAMSTLAVIAGYAAAASSSGSASEAPSTTGTTVITSQEGYVIAFDAAGSRIYHDSSMDGYWDVDPVADRRMTVLYVASEKVRGAVCQGRRWCYRLVIQTANLTTGVVETVHETHVQDQRKAIGRWHDADRVGDHRYLVADIENDAVLELDTSAKVVTWAWRVADAYEPTTGGDHAADWSHINDVEAVNESVVMVSLRNHDQVAFVHRDRGLLDGWTLGADDEHETLYEQHNPDYIHRTRGGPAVVVADSENDRVVEYQRRDDEWVRTWTWSDAQLSWPRDADRLPDGRTLVTDTYGGRVLEVAPDGSIQWSVRAPGAYEAERLGTGDESAAGPAAPTIHLESRRAPMAGGGVPTDPLVALNVMVKAIVPPKWIHAAQYLTPAWVNASELLAAGLGASTFLGWIALEARWSRWSLRLPVTWRERARSPERPVVSDDD